MKTRLYFYHASYGTSRITGIYASTNATYGATLWDLRNYICGLAEKELGEVVCMSNITLHAFTVLPDVEDRATVATADKTQVFYSAEVQNAQVDGIYECNSTDYHKILAELKKELAQGVTSEGMKIGLMRKVHPTDVLVHTFTVLAVGGGK